MAFDLKQAAAQHLFQPWSEGVRCEKCGKNTRTRQSTARWLLMSCEAPLANVALQPRLLEGEVQTSGGQITEASAQENPQAMASQQLEQQQPLHNNNLDDPAGFEEEPEWQEQMLQPEVAEHAWVEPPGEQADHQMVKRKVLRKRLAAFREELQQIRRQGVHNKRRAEDLARQKRWTAAVARESLQTAPANHGEPWMRAGHASHALVTCGGVVACTRCALQACSDRPRLHRVCAGNFPKGSDRDLRRLLAAKLPGSLRVSGLSEPKVRIHQLFPNYLSPKCE